MMKRGLWLLAALACLAPSVGQAAFIYWDDSDVSTITVTWNGFDAGGLSIDTSFPLVSGTVTLADGGHIFGGTWYDSTYFGLEKRVLFTLPSAPTFITSGVLYSCNTDWSGLKAGVSGYFGGFTGSSYGVYLGSMFPQDGHIEVFGAPGLTAFFDSEAPVASVPEPASLTLVGLGAFGLIAGAIRRRRQQQA